MQESSSQFFSYREEMSYGPCLTYPFTDVFTLPIPGSYCTIGIQDGLLWKRPFRYIPGTRSTHRGCEKVFD